MLLSKGHMIILYEDDQTELCKQNTNTIQIKLYHMRKSVFYITKYNFCNKAHAVLTVNC